MCGYFPDISGKFYQQGAEFEEELEEEDMGELEEEEGGEDEEGEEEDGVAGAQSSP